LRNLVFQLAQNGVFDAGWSDSLRTRGFAIWKRTYRGDSAPLDPDVIR
jgi:hypothetical protein